MYHHIMPKGKHQCLLYCAAMLLDEEPEALIREIGHNGMVETWKLKAPLCYNGFHMQEIIDLFLARGKALVPIEARPVCKPIDSVMHKKHYPYGVTSTTRFMNYMEKYNGILIGKSKSGVGHSCVWFDGKVYDPNGGIYDLSDFEIRDCWIMIRLAEV